MGINDGNSEKKHMTVCAYCINDQGVDPCCTPADYVVNTAGMVMFIHQQQHHASSS